MTQYDVEHPVVSARVSRITKAAIDKLASVRKENRNEIIERLLRDALIAKGVLLVEERLVEESYQSED
jgi:hypothetical protein